MDKSQLEDDLDVALDGPVTSSRDRYVIVDTEGSGLFRFKDEVGNSVPADAPGQPRMAELAMIFVDVDLKIERTFQAYICPNGWEMEPGATAVNNLTTEFLRGNGVDVVDALVCFEEAIREGRVVVAHNAQHDLKQIRAELRRADRDDLFQQTRNICTMRGLMGRGVKKANGKGGFPSLADACAHFGIETSFNHTGFSDAQGCFEVFCEMHKRGWLPEATVHLAKPPKEAA